ncbi:Transglycosylase SLT domain-containing protein [Fodinibius salinus]|uniref:Transglycosylase SLT domain-containing protein n=1 Tax=Fodinibius salinus TaxID=860790 RepID=A0A5D3YNA3_9BACT|nr:lytic murein transglycosylase [Fodinibius salinus]TYP95400.1 Transglycosylase SLT domain-containing protein [Fodinibius salinus]
MIYARSVILLLIVLFSWESFGVSSATAKSVILDPLQELPSQKKNHSDPSPEFDKELNSLIHILKKEGFDIKKLLEDPRFELYNNIADRFRKSAERKSHSLSSYKQVLGFKDKGEQIVYFLEDYQKQLDKAESQYNISRYVIAAIIGIESDFGNNVGTYNPFNAYVSMYVEKYRQQFAKAQIKELLEFVNRKNIDVYELKSSYAGAMAFAQFIPYSLNKWFVGDDIFDMNNNIMSVANYLRYFKQKTNNIETAVLRYNPSSMYKQAVMDLAQLAEKQHRN